MYRSFANLVPWFVALALLPTTAAFADIADEVNRARSAGCEGRPGIKAPLRKSAAMNEVAREWSRGGKLRDAIQRTEHRLASSSSMHVQGGKNEAAMVKALIENSCEAIVDPEFTHIGVHRTGNEVWMVVARPFTPPDPGSAREVSARALQLVNAARAKPRRCGKTPFGAAPPLALAPLLERAALAHAKDMAKHNLFEHIGSDGSRPADRVTRVGYKWRSVGENIAAGSADVETVVQGWLESPGHCSNIMGAQYKEMGIAFVVDTKSEADIYWAQVFGTAR
jgi:uncharacterized protein YkwD